MLAHSGPSDVLLFCDGRSRACRAKLESLVLSARHLSEIWIVYKPTPRLGRKVTFASDNRETAFVSLPVARTLLPTKQRAEFTGAGEASTHDSTYTGVDTVPWSALDRHALQTITTNGSPLFEQHLAAAITEHFKDVLDQLHDADAVEDQAPEVDVDIA